MFVREAMEAGYRPASLILREDAAGSETGLSDSDIHRISVTEKVMRKISNLPSPGAVVAVFDPPRISVDRMIRSERPCTILDVVQDPGNVGTIFRSAGAFGAAGVIGLKGTCRFWQEKVARASAGLLFAVPFMEADGTEQLPKDLTSRRALILDSRGGDHSVGPESIPADEPLLIVAGNEGHGCSWKQREGDLHLTIPMEPGVESLNVAQALTCILYEIYRRKKSHER